MNCELRANIAMSDIMPFFCGQTKIRYEVVIHINGIKIVD